MSDKFSEREVGRVLLSARFTKSALAVVSLLIAACGGGGSSSQSEGVQPPPGGSNSAPVISGQAPASVAVGQSYAFQPSASDANGDSLQFAAANVPPWASFDTATGRLTGTPSAGDVGNYSGIAISVTDGKATTSLPSFSISVTQIAVGSATLSWVPPTTNDDGSVLTDLAGYRIRYGRSSTNLDQSVSISNSAINSFAIDNLSPGTWFFAVVTVNSQGTESSPSNVASKTI